MRNITVFSNRLDESNGIIEHVLEMKAKKTPWYLRFAGKMRMAAAVAAAVVGIGLLAGSLSLLAEPVYLPDPIRTGLFPTQPMNVCAPVISSITVTDDGSAGFRVSVDFSHGWDMLRWVRWSPDSWKLWGYDFVTEDAVRHNPLLRADFWNSRTAQFDTVLRTADSDGRDVYFDYFARGGTGGKYFEMEITTEYSSVVTVAGKDYDPDDYWVNLTLYITDRNSRGNRLPAGEYRMHCWVSDSDGNGYYVTVYFGDEAFF